MIKTYVGVELVKNSDSDSLYLSPEQLKAISDALRNTSGKYGILAGQMADSLKKFYEKIPMQDESPISIDGGQLLAVLEDDE